MRICQITPGVFTIPPNGWGAIEKIIFNYKIELEKLGHQVDIKYPNEIKKGGYDIVHVHMYNQANMLHEMGIPYTFSMHDHHTMLHENIKDENRRALKNSILGIVPGEHLLELFGNLPNVVYLEHGVDSDFFNFKNHDDRHKNRNHSLLCVANNGILGNNTYDRKGFKSAIIASEILQIPLTIAGPSKNNKLFFDANPDLLNNKNLTVLYDLNELELLELYHKHTIFLHPSSLEAGHPNLTLLEAISTGLPVIGTYNGSIKLESLYKLKDDFFPLHIIVGINDVINDYKNYVEKTKTDILKFSWKNIVSKLEKNYLNTFNKSETDMKDQIISIYDNLKKIDNSVADDIIDVNFNDGAMCWIKGVSDKKYNIKFIDNDTNTVIYSNECTAGVWNKPVSKWYINWKVVVNDDEYILDLKNKEVLIINESPALGDIISWFPYINEFRKKHNCNITYSGPYHEIFEDNYKDINFIDYTQDTNGFYATYKIGIFSSTPNSTKERHKREWKNLTLQEVVCDILGLEYTPIQANLVVQDIGRPIKEKYVVITEWSTLKAKIWLYKDGWQTIVNYLNSKGYKVVVISKEHTNLKNIIDRTDKPILDTINTIYHSEFGMGPSTAIGWACWSLNKPYIVPSGYSEPWAEYDNPFRIINREYCHGCFNDINLNFDKGWDACPRNQNMICSTSITPDQVIEMIDKII